MHPNFRRKSAPNIGSLTPCATKPETGNVSSPIRRRTSALPTQVIFVPFTANKSSEVFSRCLCAIILLGKIDLSQPVSSKHTHCSSPHQSDTYTGAPLEVP